MLFSTKNSLMKTAVWHGALSRCSIQVRAMPGRTVPPSSWAFQGLPDKSLIFSVSWWHKFPVDGPLTGTKTNEHKFGFGFAHSRFLGTGRVCSVHSRIWRFVSGSYSKIHYSSPVITRLKNSGSLSVRSRRSRHTSLRLAFCSVVSFFGTILAHIFLMSKSCVKIWWTVNRVKFNSQLIILNVNRRSDHTRDLTLSTLSSVFEVEWLPARGSSSTSRPSKKDLCHLNTCAPDRECSP